MKQKINDTSSITKSELKEEIESIKQEIKESEKRLDQKFSKKLTDSQHAFREENNHNFQLMMDRFDERFSKFTNFILTAIDPLMKEIETRREDREMQTAEIVEIKKRLTKLENS